jgi:hypothetical protein
VAESRRERYGAHGEERARQLRYVLCQQWIEADHEEALALDRAREEGEAGEPTRDETGFAVLR